MSLFPLALGHIDKKLFGYVPLSSNTGTYSGKVSCYVPLSISTGTYRQKIIYDVPLVLSCGTYQNQFFLYMSQLYKKEGHNQELFLYMSFNHSPLPSFYLTVSCLTTSSNRFVRCLISSCETP